MQGCRSLWHPWPSSAQPLLCTQSSKLAIGASSITAKTVRTGVSVPRWWHFIWSPFQADEVLCCSPRAHQLSSAPTSFSAAIFLSSLKLKHPDLCVSKPFLFLHSPSYLSLHFHSPSKDLLRSRDLCFAVGCRKSELLNVWRTGLC